MMERRVWMRALTACAAALALAPAPTMASGGDKFFDSNGVRIHYLDQGSGPPVVLIHGYTGSVAGSWVDTGVVSNLAADHRVLALDLRGHGKSGKPHDPKAYGEQMGQDVVRLLDHLGIPRAHLVGYSMGAAITAKLLTTNPARFASAVLGGYPGARPWAAADAKAAIDAAVELEGATPFRSLILAIAPTDEPRPSEEAIRTRSRELTKRNDPLALAAYNRSRGALAVTAEQLAAVRVPMLGVIGSADSFLPGLQSLRKSVPQLEIVVIEGATHVGERDARKRPEFIKAVRAFIASQK